MVFRLIRWRTSLYAAIIAIAGGIMIFTLATRDSEGISIIHDRNPMFVAMSDGALRNGYTVRIVNKQLKTREFIVGVDGLPASLIDFVGLPPRADGRQLVTVGPDQTKEVRVMVHRLQRIAAGAVDAGHVQSYRHQFGRRREDARSFLRARHQQRAA